VDPIVAKLGTELLEAPAGKWADVLAKLRDTKGSEHTQALAYAISQLDGDQKKKAREALAERLAKLKSTFLASYMRDEDAELRRAGALACALKEDMTHVDMLIELLNDPERTVERAAYAALKELTKQDFGPAANATDSEKSAAVKAWRDWWKKQAEK
jgi:HEAT repeat protein